MTQLSIDWRSARKKLQAYFTSRETMLGCNLMHLSTIDQPCDVTFYEREPILDVKVDPLLGLAMMQGAGAEKLQEKLSPLRFSNGTRASLGEIWTVNPMPINGISVAELDGINLDYAEQAAGPGGETIRDVISITYHCRNREEEDRFLRRLLAS